MDSRLRFVLAYATLAMVPFTFLTFVNTTDFGTYVGAYAIVYFALRLVMNPRLRLRVDPLGIALLVLFVYFVAVSAAPLLGVTLP